MADSTAPAAAAQDVPNLHKDEVTGEMVSKSELKKRQKKREADKRKVLIFANNCSGILLKLLRRLRRPSLSVPERRLLSRPLRALRS